MKYFIDESIVQKEGLHLNEFLVLLLIKSGESINNTINTLIDNNMIIDRDGKYYVTQHIDDICDNILLSSEKSIPTDDDLEPLALEMMKVVPQTKMPGTPYYYKCNKREVILKLKKFFKLYGYYSNEDIIKATKRYYDNPANQYKKILKYFIHKGEKKQDEEGNYYVEEVSLLATELENIDSSDTETSNNWINELK